MEELYAGMDLHTRNTYIEIMEKDSKKKVFEKRVPNHLSLILGLLSPLKTSFKSGAHLQLALACGWSDGCGLWMYSSGQSFCHQTV